MAHSTLLHVDPLDLVEPARQAGFDRIGIRLLPVTSNERDYQLVGDRKRLAQLKRRLDAEGIGTLDVEVVRLGPETDVAAEYEPMLDAAAFLGAREVLVVGDDDNEDRIAKRFAQLCDLAQPFDMYANLEFLLYRGIKTINSASRVVELANHPHGRVLVDTLHFKRSGGHLDDVRVLAEDVRYVQVCDAANIIPSSADELIHEARHGRLLPGEGCIDLANLLSIFPENLPLSLEVPNTKWAETSDLANIARSCFRSLQSLVVLVDEARSQIANAESR